MKLIRDLTGCLIPAKNIAVIEITTKINPQTKQETFWAHAHLSKVVGVAAYDIANGLTHAEVRAALRPIELALNGGPLTQDIFETLQNLAEAVDECYDGKLPTRVHYALKAALLLVEGVERPILEQAE